jgi:glycosyltransferase involved in cell wall biosynthesis
VERKGVQVLLGALAKLREGPPMELRIVGDGPWRERLESLVGELGVTAGVEFTGFVAQEELSASFAWCDAFVLPAVADAKGDVEGLGVVLIEALAHGRPVIASRSGGIPDIVLDEVTGLLVPPGDEAALAAAIERLRSDPALARRLAFAGRAHVEASFSWEVVLDRLVALYERAAASRRGRTGG